jgi:hypothetical protein
MVGMAWALAAIVILGLGVPIGALVWSRLRPPPAVTPLGSAYDRIDKWLLRQHGLRPVERERVRAAVFGGRQASGPELEPAAHDLAARLLAGQLGAVRLGRALIAFNGVMATGFLAGGIVLLVVSRSASGRGLGALGLVDSALFTFAGVMSTRQSRRTRRNLTLALRLNKEQD